MNTQIADATFSNACVELHRIADINRAAVEATIEAFDHSSLKERHYAPQSIAMAFRQLVDFNQALRLLALDYELATAHELV